MKFFYYGIGIGVDTISEAGIRDELCRFFKSGIGARICKISDAGLAVGHRNYSYQSES